MMLDNQSNRDQIATKLDTAAMTGSGKRYNSALHLPKQPARILIVDDDPDVVEVLTVSMMMEGYQVQSTTSSLEALGLLDEFSPDLMCIDYMMPNLDGQQLAQQIRARHDMLYVPIVMLTAVSQDEVKLASLDSGVDAFLIKPVKRNELRVVIRTLLRMKTAQDTMLAALDRVAEVQDELLAYEREQSHYAASQAATASYTRELQAPLEAATTASRGLEQIIEQSPSEVRETGRAYLHELNRALVQAQQALRHLEASR